MKKILSKFSMGNIDAYYISDEQKTGLVILPKGIKLHIAEDKKKINAREQARDIDQLIQVKLVGDAYPGAFGNGVTMHNSGTSSGLRFIKQKAVCSQRDVTTIITEMEGPKIRAKHELVWHHGYDALESSVTVINTFNETIGLEMLASFSLGMLSPLDQEYKPNKLLVHRLRGRWAQESKLESQFAEELMLSPSACGAVDVHSERFGQRGNKTSGVFSPFLAVEDIENSILWGAQLAIDGSWQMEVFNCDDTLSISGGLPDYDFGHWVKNLKSGESFTSPIANIAVCRGDLDTLCDKLTSIQEKYLQSMPESEDDLPIMFNEWCSSWGSPSQENIFKQLDALTGKPIKYFIIDAGWYKEKEHQWFEMVGDWEPSLEKYPEGLKKIADKIKEAGMIPGLWCEIETCGTLSRAFQLEEHLLTKFGKQIVSNNRKYWDFRDSWTIDYLTKKVVNLLEDTGIGYLKIDSNECVGVGCDGAESLGEGLRQNLECFEQFILLIKKRLPSLIIENCSSGGQRVTPKMTAIFPLFSCSDSFECSAAPIVSANMHRVALPRQSQIWCTLRSSDSEKKIISALSTGFLGRMCLSGDIISLSKEQLVIVDKALSYYRSAVSVIKNGFSKRFGPQITNYAVPNGWQAIVREAKENDEAMVVIHTFDIDVPDCIEIPMSFPEYEPLWSFKREFTLFDVKNGMLKLNCLEKNEGMVIMLKRK